jgi:hypothetical protein
MAQLNTVDRKFSIQVTILFIALPAKVSIDGLEVDPNFRWDDERIEIARFSLISLVDASDV